MRGNKPDDAQNHRDADSISRLGDGASGLRQRTAAGSDSHACRYGNAHCYGHPSARNAGLSITGPYAANSNTHAATRITTGGDAYKDTDACAHHAAYSRTDGNTNAYSGAYAHAYTKSDSRTRANGHTGPNAKLAQPNYESEERRLAGTQPTGAGNTTYAIALDCRWR